MKDETYAFISDVKEKKVTARSARNTRRHCGKGGKVRLPSDNLSKKELQKMNGECKSYRLNDPLKWHEFISMPDDLKVTYIKLLRQKYNVPDKYIAEMFGINKDYIHRKFKALGLGREIKTSHPKWDKDGFYAWWHGVDKIPVPVAEEIPVEEPILEEPEPVIIAEELGPFVEEDLPFAEPDFVPVEKYRVMDDCIADLEFRMKELLKENEELKAVHEKDREKISWLEVRVDELGNERHILEAQMDVVRLIFGGKNHG